MTAASTDTKRALCFARAFLAALLGSWSCAGVEAALVHHYTFDSNANDAVGGDDGTLGGNAAIVTSDKKIGSGSVDIGSTADYVDFDFTSGNKSQVTVSMWFKPDTTSGFQMLFASADDADPGNIHFALNGTALWGEVIGGATLQFTNAVNDTTAWWFTAMTWDRNQTNGLKLYLAKEGDADITTHDAQKDATDTDTLFGTNAATGAATYNTGSTYDDLYEGHIDDLAIWDHALSPSELQIVRESGAAALPLPGPAAMGVGLLMLFGVLRRPRRCAAAI